MDVDLYKYYVTHKQAKGDFAQLPLYPAVLHLQEAERVATVTIATPPELPWENLWLSVGVSLATLAETYRAFVTRLYDSGLDAPVGGLGPFGSFSRDSSGKIVFSASNTYIDGGGDPRVLRLSYGSPTAIELVFAFPAAIWALAQLVIKIHEFREKQEKLSLEARNLKLQNEKLRREINNLVLEARKREAQGIEAEPKDDPLLIYGQMLTGSERVFIVRDFSFADQAGRVKPHIIGGE